MGRDIPAHNTNTDRDNPIHNTNLGEADDGEGAATIGAHLDEKDGGIAVGGEDVLVGVGWGGRSNSPSATKNPKTSLPNPLYKAEVEPLISPSSVSYIFKPQ